MRNRTALAYLVTLVITGCGDDGDQTTPDAAPEPPPPRLIEGGGIGDGPIEGVANVYVIDDATSDPISGATVRVGDVEGTTDATGLFIAEGVTGKQTVLVKATDHRSEMWIGANGSNMTFALMLGADPNPRSATMTGALSLSSLDPLDPNHVYFAQVGYSASDDLGDDENEIPTPNNTHQCLFTTKDSPCTFTIVTRTGKVALFASVIDVDTKGTTTGTDDTFEQVAWAFRPAATVAANATMTGMDLAPIVGNDLADLTVDFGAPPSALTERGALIQVELPDRALMSLGFVTPASPTLKAPKVSAVTGATAFRLIAIATTGGDPPSAESIVLRRHQSGSPLSAGAWLTPPGSTDVSRTGASWGPVSGATVHTVEFTQGTANLLNVTSLDDTSLFTVPELLALPGGTITAKVGAIGATGFDVTNFSLDADRDKLDRVSARTIELP